MQEIRGQGRNTTRYIYEGYQYHIDTTSVHIFRCSKRSSTGCQGVARVDDQGRVNVYKAHQGHDANPTIYEELTMQNEMVDLATTTNTPFREIFDTVCRRNAAIAPRIVWDQVRNMMQRARARVRPIIPASLRDLATALDTYAPTEGVYRGLVEADDDSIALIFTSDQLLAALQNAKEIYVDGTFKVAPNHPPVAQLYTIHIREKDIGIATVFVLCSSRTRSLYSAIFAKIKLLAPGLSDNLQFIMGDYERAAMGALREAFPAAQLHGCWFHFNQALGRKWRGLGLANAPKTVLSLGMALPLAPCVQFDEGLALLATEADEIAENYPAILQFMRYLRTQWRPLAEVVSVHGCPIRTNNLVESFHNGAKRKLGGLHPNIWKFIEHLLNMITDQGIDLVRVLNNQRPRPGRAIRYMMKDTIIRDAQHALSVRRFTLRQFLERCVTRTAGYRVNRDNIAEEEAPEQEVLVEPGILTAGNLELNEPVQRRGRRPNLRNRAVAAPVRPIAEDPADLDPDDPVPREGQNNPRLNEPVQRRGRRPNLRNRDVAAPVRPIVEDPADLDPDDPVPREGQNNPRLNEPVQRRGRRLNLRNRADAAPVLPIVEEAIAPPNLQGADQDDPVPRRGHDEDDDPERALLPDLDDDIFHLPEDDFEAFEIPVEPVPYHPVVQIENMNRADLRRQPGTCCVCIEEAATHVFVPCGHQCCCADCAEEIVRAGRCPMCRVLVTSTVRVILNV